MKKVAAFIIAVLVTFSFAGCQTKAPVNKGAKNGNGTSAVNLTDNGDNTKASGEVVELKTKMFVAQINDIYLNPEDYIGKTIKYEGIFTVYFDSENDKLYYSVIRYGPGCCGNDGNAGFEVVWDKDYEPVQDDWVEVVGVLEQYTEDDYDYLRIKLSSLKKLTKRGVEFVTQ